MKTILFVCHGNICRSPLAQSVFVHMAAQMGMAEEFMVDSFATSREEIGNPPHYGTVNKLRQQRVPLIPHRAKQITIDDYRRSDLILVMDSQNLRNLHRLLGGDPEGKIRKLLSFAAEDGDIADPWYTGNFDATYADVVRGCRGLLEQLKKDKGR